MLNARPVRLAMAGFIAAAFFAPAARGPVWAQERGDDGGPPPIREFDLGEDEGPEPDAAPDEGPGDAAVAAAARLRDAVRRIDPGAEFFDAGATFRVAGAPVTLVYDINADRMRLMAPVRDLETVDPDELLRMMQANFDSALDARYAVARGVVWAAFIHPLSTLSGEEFGSGLGQTVNLVASFGSTYSSGAIVFGGGDSADQQRALIEELQEKSRDI